MDIQEILEEDGAIQRVLTFQISNNSEIFEADQEFVAEQWKTLLRTPSSEQSIILTKDCDVKVNVYGSKSSRNRIYVLLPKEKHFNESASYRQRLLAISVGHEESFTTEGLLLRLKAVYGEDTYDIVSKKSLSPTFAKEEKIPLETILIVKDREDMFHHEAGDGRQTAEFGEVLDTIRHPTVGSTHTTPDLMKTLPTTAVKPADSCHDLHMSDDHVQPTEDISRAKLGVNSLCVEETPSKVTTGGVPVGGIRLMTRGHMNSVVGVESSQANTEGKDRYIPCVALNSTTDGVKTDTDSFQPLPSSRVNTEQRPAANSPPLPHSPTVQVSTVTSPPVPARHQTGERFDENEEIKLKPVEESTFKNVFERDSLHALEHNYNGLDSPCVMKALHKSCTKEDAGSVIDQHQKLLNHNTVICIHFGCKVCQTVRNLSKKHSTFCSLESACHVPHCITTRKNSITRTPTPLDEGSSSVSSPKSNSLEHDLPVPVQQTQREEITFREGYHYLCTAPSGPRDEYLPTGGRLPNSMLSCYVMGYNRVPKVLPAVHSDDKSLGGQILGEMGEGGNGKVFKVRENGRIFAVKECKYLVNEVHIWKTLVDPHLMPLLGVKLSFSPITGNGVRVLNYLYMPVMDTDLRKVFVKSGAVADLMRSCCLRSKRIVMDNCKHILRGILKGLCTLHQQGFVHRDIKEHNVMLSFNCSCKDVLMCQCPEKMKCDVVLTDFDSIVSKTKACQNKGCSHVAGTHGYRPPEVFDHVAYPASDVYGFGTIVVKMFGGRNIDKEKQKMLMLCGDAKERCESLIAQFKLMDLSLVEEMREVVEFVQKCLSADYKERKTAAELLSDAFLK